MGITEEVSSRRRTIRIGVDSGGTFTDLCLFDPASGDFQTLKVPSTPLDPSQAILDGVLQLVSAADVPRVSYLGHGTTVGTNAVIERRGAAAGLLTTAGFRDVLEIGRQRRTHLYDLRAGKPEPLVPRRLRAEVAERVHADGSVARPLDENSLRRAITELRAEGAQSIAVCLLYSYLRPEHELLVRKVIAEEVPDVFVSLSHEVVPEFREFERTSTVVLNAYLVPVMAEYLSRLRTALTEMGIGAGAYVTQSNGGIVSFDTAESRPVGTVLSGPSTGLIAAARLAEEAGHRNVITLDIGGTSADVSLIVDSRPRLVNEVTIEGHPLKTAALDISTVGAGGGSIAWVDSGGHLRVGPHSAGADPGPAAYGRGGDRATVTDANVFLGRLGSSQLLANSLHLDVDAARRAVEGLAAELSLDPQAAALGVIKIVVANMARAIRVISVQRGHDPREFTLFAFGGAGPLHAALLARELRIPRVLIPEVPGVLCALGLLLTDLQTSYSLTRPLPLERSSVGMIADTFAQLSERAQKWFESEGVPPDERVLTYSADMRYAGQNFELTVPLSDNFSAPAFVAAAKQAFLEEHQRAYGFTVESEEIQAVTFRLDATAHVGAAEQVLSRRRPDVMPEPTRTRSVCFDADSGYVDCRVHNRYSLESGRPLQGPAVIEQMDSTVLVLPGQTAVVDPFGNLIIEEAA